MKIKLSTGAGLTITAGLLLAGSGTVVAGYGNPGPAPYVNSEGGCLMYDRAGLATVTGDKTHVTIADSGNISARCQISAKDSGLGAGERAVKFSGFVCIAEGELTTKTFEVIDAAGNVTMTCQYKKSS